MTGAGCWLSALRVRTLPASLTPVLVGTALAYYHGGARPAVAALCALFALLGQLAANLANDYGDGVRGTDGASRVGQTRAVGSGLITPRAMRTAVAFALALMLLTGAALVWLCGWWVAAVALACAFGAAVYTPLAYHGWGDALVVVFFGWVAVGFTCYAQTALWTPAVWLAGTAAGLGSAAILTVNNYRDRDTDRACGKLTLIARFGEPFGRALYLLDGLLASLACLALLASGHLYAALLPQLYLLPHLILWRRLSRIRSGASLNPLIGATARALLLLGLLLSAGLLLDSAAASAPNHAHAS